MGIPAKRYKLFDLTALDEEGGSADAAPAATAGGDKARSNQNGVSGEYASPQKPHDGDDGEEVTRDAETVATVTAATILATDTATGVYFLSC